MENCPLSGQPCPHKKCIHITEIADYTATSCKDMCIFCGVPYVNENELSIKEAEVNSVFEIISNVLKEKQVSKNIKTCPSCGFTIKDIANTSRIGCADCYTHFKTELEPFLLNYHKALKHVGKCPKSKLDLKKALEEAISKEDYELASKIKKAMLE